MPGPIAYEAHPVSQSGPYSGKKLKGQGPDMVTRRPASFRSCQGVMGPAHRCMPTSRAAARKYISR